VTFKATSYKRKVTITVQEERFLVLLKQNLNLQLIQAQPNVFLMLLAFVEIFKFRTKVCIKVYFTNISETGRGKSGYRAIGDGRGATHHHGE
jgi:hypothetical protein